MRLYKDYRNPQPVPNNYTDKPQLNTLTYNRLVFLGDLNIKGLLSEVQSTVTYDFLDSINLWGIKEALNVLPLEYWNDGGDRLYLVVNGQRRGLGIKHYIDTKKPIQGHNPESYPIPIKVEKGNPYSEASIDALQLVLNNQKELSKKAYISLIHKWILLGFKPTRIAEMLNISRQLVNHYSTLTKNVDAKLLYETGAVALSTASKMSQLAKKYDRTIEDIHGMAIQIASTKGRDNVIVDDIKQLGKMWENPPAKPKNLAQGPPPIPKRVDLGPQSSYDTPPTHFWAFDTLESVIVGLREDELPSSFEDLAYLLRTVTIRVLNNVPSNVILEEIKTKKTEI